MFLLDTNILSETRRPRPSPTVMAWLLSIPDGDLHVSAVTIGELQAGVENLREKDAAKAAEIEIWLELVASCFNIIPMDERAFRRWARLNHRQPKHLIEDAMIAATAEVHGLKIVSRDVRDFECLGCSVLNPFEQVD